jgi:hypothetical protein
VSQHGSDGPPPGEHDDELPDETEQTEAESELQEENAETSLDQPSQ